MNWETAFTRLFNIKYPIVQGGLAHLAYSDLAAAVSNAGCLGQITALSLPKSEDLRTEIRKIRTLTNKPFAVNFAIGASRRQYEDYLQIAIEEKVPGISITGGNPAPVLKRVEGTGIKTLVLVATRRQAEKAAQLGADVVIVVGQEGGGHIGRDDLGTMVLTPRVADHLSIPVLASGGISDGRGLMAALALGADGIEMGTRFIATKECIHAHQTYKEALLAADETSTTVIKRSLGTPGRVLGNLWTDKIISLEKQGGGYDVLASYISGEANKRYAHDGQEAEGFVWAGQGVGLINDIPTVQDLVNNIITEAEKIRERWRVD